MHSVPEIGAIEGVRNLAEFACFWPTNFFGAGS